MLDKEHGDASEGKTEANRRREGERNEFYISKMRCRDVRASLCDDDDDDDGVADADVATIESDRVTSGRYLYKNLWVFRFIKVHFAVVNAFHTTKAVGREGEKKKE